ncbi:MAG: signal peptidase I [Oceanicoccus sp.]|jgi:signal peptidase I
MISRINKIWRENRSFVLFLSLMFIFRSAIADWNEVPTGSMKPTILEGDRIFVNKMAYDIRVPFTHIPIYKIADPARGDIIIFDSEKSDKRLVKRVVGIPNDVVEMLNNVLKINGRELDYRGLSQSNSTIDMLENLIGVEHRVRVSKAGSRLSSFKPVVVPENFYLALGDNRDNSADSRVIGMVPRNEIVGRSSSVVLSLDYDNYYIPRSGRFFETL